MRCLRRCMGADMHVRFRVELSLLSPLLRDRSRKEGAELAKLEEALQGLLGEEELQLPAESETEEQRNKFLVLRLYEALNARDSAAVQALLAPDLEWWFHGPPKHRQHMIAILTGNKQPRSSSFRFVPRSVDAFGGTVIAESSSSSVSGGGVYWVHAWTVGADGVITQLREYFNTDLTVTRLLPSSASSSSSSSLPPPAKAAAAAANKPSRCVSVWQSRRPDRATNSLPALLLAI